MDFQNIFQSRLKKVKTLKSVFFGVQKPRRAIYQNLYKICDYDINLQALLYSKWYSFYILNHLYSNGELSQTLF